MKEDQDRLNIVAQNERNRLKQPESAEKHNVGFMFLEHKKAQSNM